MRFLAASHFFLSWRKNAFYGMIGEAVLLEAITMEPEIPWLKRFEEKQQEKPDDDRIDYEVMLMELEYR